MKKKLLVVFACFFILVFAFTSCVTPYQERGLTGGYTDGYLGNNTWLIEVQGNGFISAGTLIQYFYRRANEIKEIYVYDDFEVLELNVYDSTGAIIRESGGTYTATPVKKYTVIGMVKYYKNNTSFNLFDFLFKRNR